MTVITENISLQTGGHGAVENITELVADVLLDSGLKSGMVVIFSPSATSALTTLEFESGCVQDLQRFVDEIIPEDREYAHNLRWGDGNGHSHLRAALFKPSLSIPFVNGRMTLGTWQQIVFLDFDNRPRKRSLVVQIQGE